MSLIGVLVSWVEPVIITFTAGYLIGQYLMARERDYDDDDDDFLDVKEIGHKS